MRRLRELTIIGGLAIATTMFPAMAQEGQQPAPPTEDHGAHHNTTDHPAGQQSPSGGMMGQGGGMMGQGGGMMGQRQGGMMDEDGKPGGCPRMGDMMGSGGHDMGKGMRHGMMHSVPMMEARLAYIKADLEITEAQMPAWDAYAEAVRARHGAMDGVHADMMKAKQNGNVVERMEARIKAMESMVDSLKALKPATEALYAVLTDEQKKKADQLLGGRCGMM